MYQDFMWIIIEQLIIQRNSKKNKILIILHMKRVRIRTNNFKEMCIIERLLDKKD